MKQLLSIVAISLVLTSATMAFGRNYTPYPAKAKRDYIRGFTQGCNPNPNTNRRFCLAVAKCIVQKAEYNISFKEFWKVNMRILKTGRLHQPLLGYAKQCIAENGYLLY